MVIQFPRYSKGACVKSVVELKVRLNILDHNNDASNCITYQTLLCLNDVLPSLLVAFINVS